MGSIKWVVCAFLVRIFFVVGDGNECLKAILFVVIWECYLQEAADVAHQCTANNGTVAASWKLLGDIEVCINPLQFNTAGIITASVASRK